MKTRRDYLAHLQAAKAIETMLTLQAQGYRVEENAKVGDCKADLVARKGDETIVFEFKSTGGSTRRNGENQLLSYAKRRGYGYRLIIVNTPERIEVEIEDLENTLHEYLVNSEFPSELYDVASTAFINDVVDLEIISLHVGKDEIRVKGHGTIEVTLEYGGGEDRDGVTSTDEFPLDFDVSMDHDLNITSAGEIRVDTSSFFE
jgi:Holliday junction resolvase